MPSTRRCGVVSTLPKGSLPVVSSNTAMSVKVPRMSAARRRPERELSIVSHFTRRGWPGQARPWQASMAHGQAMFNGKRELRAGPADDGHRGVKLDAQGLRTDPDGAFEQV